MKPLQRIVGTTLGTVVFAVVTQWVYAHLITEQFAYLGFTYRVEPWPFFVAAVVATVAVAITLPIRVVRPSHALLWLLFVICVAPTMLICHYSGYLDPVDAITLTFVVGGAFTAVSLLVPRTPSTTHAASLTTAPLDAGIARTDTVRIGSRAIRRVTLFWAFCLIHSIATYSVMLATTGLSFHLPSLGDVYDVRAEYKDDVGPGGLLNYLLPSQAGVVNIAIFARALARKNWWLVAAVVGAQALLYSGTGFKTVLFSFPAVLLMTAVTRRGRSPKSTWFLIGPTVLMALAAIADSAQGSITWTSLFARRFIVTPGLLSSVYVDYFEQTGFAHYGYSFLHSWVDYPFDAPPAVLIAQFLSPGSAGNANANLFADGFANFGYVGVAAAAGVLLVWLRIVDRVATGLPLGVGAVVLLMPAITLSNSSIFTSLLTHGLVVGTVLLSIAPRSGWYRVQARVGGEVTADSNPTTISIDDCAAAVASSTARRSAARATPRTAPSRP